MLLSELPTELLIRTFDELDLVSLLNTNLISQRCHDIFSTSLTLHYRVRLLTHGMVNGRPGIQGMETIAKRLQALEDYISAWKTITPRRKTTIRSIENRADLYELYGGVWARGTKGPKGILTFTDLPSIVRNVELKSRDLSGLGVHLRDFSFDPGLNLLVLVEQMSSLGGIRVHFLDLTTFKIHARAAEPGYVIPSITYPQDGDVYRHTMTFQIHGDLVGVHFHISSETLEADHLSIWHWPSGRQVNPEVTLNRRIGSFALLSAELFVIATYTHTHTIVAGEHRQPPALEIYSLPSVARMAESDDMQEAKSLRTLLFPAVDFPTLTIVKGLRIRSDPNTYHHPPEGNASAPPPFHYDPMHRLFVVSMSILYNAGESIRSFSFFIPMTTFMYWISPESFEKIPDPTLKWADWGREGSRIMERYNPTPTYVCFVYGMKCIIVPQVDLAMEILQAPRRIVIYDFSPFVVKLTQYQRLPPAFIEDDDARVSREIVDDAVEMIDNAFNEEVVSQLPYLKTTTKAKYKYYSALMDFDSIILFKDQAAPGRNRSLRVWTM